MTMANIGALSRRPHSAFSPGQHRPARQQGIPDPPWLRSMAGRLHMSQVDVYTLYELGQAGSTKRVSKPRPQTAGPRHGAPFSMTSSWFSSHSNSRSRTSSSSSRRSSALLDVPSMRLSELSLSSTGIKSVEETNGNRSLNTERRDSLNSVNSPSGCFVRSVVTATSAKNVSYGSSPQTEKDKFERRERERKLRLYRMRLNNYFANYKWHESVSWEQFSMEYNEELDIRTTPLYAYILKATKASLRDAWRLIGEMPEEDIRARSFGDRSSYLHHLVSQAPEVHRRYKNLNYLIPLIYKLAMKGVKVNALNEHGNTALHLACLKPKGEELYSHLIRIGVDPCIRNKKDCRVIHTYKGHKCTMVKGQQSAKSGIWNAVQSEDIELVEKLMKTWCRVNTRKNKCPKDIAEEHANYRLIRLLAQYADVNDVICAAFTCDVLLLREVMARTSRVKLDICADESCEPPKPLVVALQELGEWSAGVVRVLRQHGVDGGRYEDIVKQHQAAFEDAEFYLLLDAGTEENILKALDLILENKVDVNLTSYAEDTKGWTYLHLVVDRYLQMRSRNEERSRLFIRAIYRLAMAGIDVNVRDSNGDTALIKASATGDQNLMAHMIRIGCDPSLADKKGRTVNENVYEDKGKLVFDNKYRVADLPGVWVAVDSNDVGKAERWLKSWSRVNTRRGDRSLMDVAKAQKRDEIIQLLEEYEHINEFVCSVFACDIEKMKYIIALGKGPKKVNTIDEFFHVGYTWDRHAEFMPRPIIVNALEICTPQVVDFLMKFKTNLSKQHAESPPCGPVAFWAFRDHVSNDNALIIAQHADVNLRDELGQTMLHHLIKKLRPNDVEETESCTMVHRAIRKNNEVGKMEILHTLLERGVDLTARDWEGSTARDYITIHNVPNGDLLRQQIDDFILELVNNDEHYTLETFLLNGYDHVFDITGMRRNKQVTAREIAELREFKEMIELFDIWKKYRGEVDQLHEAAKTGDLRTLSKLASERRCAWGKDKAGRSLLHNAVLFQHPHLVTFLCEQFPGLVNATDSLLRTPLHICVSNVEERDDIWPTLQDTGADMNKIDANNMNVYEYVRQLEYPTPTNKKLPGRRWRDYRPSQVIEWERNQKYGVKAEAHELTRLIEKCIKKQDEESPEPQGRGLSDIKIIAKGFPGVDLTIDDLDCRLLKLCVENKRETVALYLIQELKCRPHADVKISNEDGSMETMSLRDFAKRHNMKELSSLIKSTPKPDVEEPTENGEQS